MKCASGKPATVSISNAPIYFYGAQLEKIEPVTVDTAELLGTLPTIFAQAGEQYLQLAARMESYTNAFPRRIDCGRFVTVAPTEWTSGFFPGSLWLLYEATGNDKFKTLAKKYTDQLEQIRHFTGNHDIGFMLMCSVGNGYRLANIEGYREILLDGAAALCTRYNEKMNLIRSWNGIAAWTIGMRAMQKALLQAFLEPRKQMLDAEKKGDYAPRMIWGEAAKTLPFGAIWDKLCLDNDCPTDTDLLCDVKKYENNVLAKR